MENIIPKEALVNVLDDYRKIYNLVTKSQDAYKYMCKKAKSSLLYLLQMAIYLILTIVTLSAVAEKPSDWLTLIGALSIILFVRRLITFESQEVGKNAKIWYIF